MSISPEEIPDISRENENPPRRGEIKVRKNEMKLRKNEMKVRKNFFVLRWIMKNLHRENSQFLCGDVKQPVDYRLLALTTYGYKTIGW